MKQYLYTVLFIFGIIGTYGTSNGMVEVATARVDFENSKLSFFSDQNRELIQIQYAGSDRFAIPSNMLVFVHAGEVEAKLLSLLESLNTNRFGVVPNESAVIDDDAVFGFKNVSFPSLQASIFDLFAYCSENQRKRLIDGIFGCARYAIQTRLKFDQDLTRDKSSVKLYFDNVLEKLFEIINTLSLMNKEKPFCFAEQYKIITMDLIACGDQLYTSEYRKSAKGESEKNIEWYDGECKKRIEFLDSLAQHGDIGLSGEDCYVIIKSLNFTSADKSLLLGELSNRGMMLMKKSCNMYSFPELQTTFEVLQKINVQDLKNDKTNLLPYVATAFCLGNIDNLSFSMPAYDAYTQDEDRIRRSIIAAALEILTKLRQ